MIQGGTYVQALCAKECRGRLVSAIRTPGSHFGSFFLVLQGWSSKSMNDVDWNYQFLLLLRLIFGIIAFVLLCFTLIQPSPFYIVLTLLVVLSPILLRKYIKSKESRAYPYLLIIFVLIIIFLLKLSTQKSDETNNSNSDTSGVQLSSIEQERQTNFALLRAEGEAERSHDPKVKKAFLQAQKENMQANICNLVSENLDKVQSCSIVLDTNKKVSLSIKYQYQSSFGFSDNERTLAFKLAHVLHALFNDSYRFKTVRLIGYGDLTDSYGNTKNEPFAIVNLSENQAYKLNWKVDSAMLPEYLPNVWHLSGPIMNGN